MTGDISQVMRQENDWLLALDIIIVITFQDASPAVHDRITAMQTTPARMDNRHCMVPGPERVHFLMIAIGKGIVKRLVDFKYVLFHKLNSDLFTNSVFKNDEFSAFHFIPGLVVREWTRSNYGDNIFRRGQHAEINNLARIN
jgi:hypothetical protein